MTNNTHDLQFTILLSISFLIVLLLLVTQAYLESLVLKNTLNGCIFSGGRELGLEDYPERAITHDLTLGILHLLGFAGKAILHFLTNNLYESDQPLLQCIVERGSCLPPMRKLVKPAGRFCVDILAGQNDRVLRCYREYGGLEVSSR